MKKLTASDGWNYDEFGAGVALSGRTAIAGRRVRVGSAGSVPGTPMVAHMSGSDGVGVEAPMSGWRCAVGEDDARAGFKPAPTRRHGLGEIVRGFKTFSARRVNAARQTSVVPLWQRNYYEHVVRDDAELDRIREYIISNPANWESDEYYAV